MEEIEIDINKVKYKICIPYDKENIKDVVIVCLGITTKEYRDKIKNIIKKLTQDNHVVVCFDFIQTSRYRHLYKEKLCLYEFEEKLNLIYYFIKEKYPKYEINIFSVGFGAYVTLVSIAYLNLNFRSVILNTPAINMREIFKRKLAKENLIDFYKINTKKFSKEKMEEITDFYNELTRRDLLKNDKYLYNITILHEENNVIPIEDSIFYINNMCKNSEFIKIDFNTNLTDIVVKKLNNK